MLLTEKSVTVPRELRELLQRFSDARLRSDALFDVVLPDALYERPIPERHRIIFYVGHLEAFDWNLLKQSLGSPNSGHPELDRLFAFGIDPVGGGLPSDQPSDWPAADVVKDYVGNVRSALDRNLEKAMLDHDFQSRDGFSLSTLLNVAVEHRLMHVETLAYLLHQLPLDKKVGPSEQSNLPTLAGRPVVHRQVAIPEGVATLGLPRG